MSYHTVMILGCPARRRKEDHDWRAMNNGTTAETMWLYCAECGTTKLGVSDGGEDAE